MGRKRNWFSAIKRVFTSNSKDKPQNEIDKKSFNEKKSRGRFKHGESRSFIPLFREPSSIEKILGEVDQQLLFIGQPTPVDQPTTPQQPVFSGRPASPRAISGRPTSPRTISGRPTSPRAISGRPTSPRAISGRPTSPRVISGRLKSPRVTSPRALSPRNSPPRVVNRRAEIGYRPEPTLRHHHFSATVIQAAYRGYMARRSFRALRGLVRLQGVVRGQNVKRQTVNAMKQMQLLVRVQTQIQSRRIQMLENQAIERQTYNKNDKEVESSLGKWTFSNLLEIGDEHWDDSLITKEEREARLQRKMEAVIKRERAMAYAYSNQLWKATPKSAQTALTNIRSGGSPWWWNWLERQLPSDEPQKPPESSPTPPRPNSNRKTSPHPQSTIFKQTDFSFENLDTPTPRSSKSTAPPRARNFTTPSRTPPPSKSKRSVAGGSPFPTKDDDSLMSCPPFSVPNYMSPTVSAKAKARPDRLTSTASVAASETTSSKRRFSFPLTTQNIGSTFNKWSKRSSSKDETTSQGQRGMEKHTSPRSIGDMSMDSAISMPAAFGRKPFNRFV